MVSIVLIVFERVSVLGTKAVKVGIDSKETSDCLGRVCFCGRLCTDGLAVSVRDVEDADRDDDCGAARGRRAARRPPPGCAFTLAEEEATNFICARLVSSGRTIG